MTKISPQQRDRGFVEQQDGVKVCGGLYIQNAVSETENIEETRNPDGQILKRRWQ